MSDDTVMDVVDDEPPFVGLWRSTARQEPHPIGRCDDDECSRCWNPPG